VTDPFDNGDDGKYLGRRINKDLSDLMRLYGRKSLGDKEKDEDKESTKPPDPSRSSSRPGGPGAGDDDGQGADDEVTNKEGDEADEDEDADQGDDEGACECDCQACKSKPGRHDRGCEAHPCEQVDEEDREMCYQIWSELEKLQDALEVVQDAVNVAEGIDDLNKALSSLNESTGGALVAPSVRPSGLGNRLGQLRGRRDELTDRLRGLGVELIRRNRRGPGKPRRGRRRLLRRKR
jgi:hypothetical protein